MFLKKWATGGSYSFVRMSLGIYLFVHFAQLVRWGPELFSSHGLLPLASASPLAHPLNLLTFCDSPAVLTGLLLAAAGGSLAFAFGFHDRIAAMALWYVWACLLGRNPLILNPSIPYVGWMLLAHACLAMTARESAGDGRPSEAGHMPKEVYAVAWILLSVGYSYSGVTKLASPSWLDGTAIQRVLETPLARPGLLREGLLSLPHSFLKLSTWAALGLELFFAPLALVPRLRPLLWSLMLAMHVALILLVDFADLSLGMVMYHLFTFDPGWRAGFGFRSRDSAGCEGS